jgi:hypothetical protein
MALRHEWENHYVFLSLCHIALRNLCGRNTGLSFISGPRMAAPTRQDVYVVDCTVKKERRLIPPKKKKAT